MALVRTLAVALQLGMDAPFLNPHLVTNRRLRFEHSHADVVRACEFLGADEHASAREIVMGVHERMRILASAFGIGMPKTLGDIVERAGGNCVSHAVLATVVLRQQGFSTRLMVEDVYTDASLLRAPGALLAVPIGPTLNGHVWIETLADDEWIPADPQLGLYGTEDWIRARVLRGVSLAAMGVPVRERWRFPLRIRRLGPDGTPAENVTGLYLIGRVRSVVGRDALPRAWEDGVAHFANVFDWQGRSGLRLLGERRRLNAMFKAVESLR